jgi:hypothetical protein
MRRKAKREKAKSRKDQTTPRMFKRLDHCGSSKQGQATVEYVIVAGALIAVVLALGAFADRVEEGLFVEHAADSASHSAGSNTMGVIGDVLLY